MIRLLFCLLLVAAATLAHAGPSASVDELQAKASALALATDPQWLALLHVNRGGTLRDRGRSYVDDPRFFLDPHGHEDPAAELAATLRALFAEDALAGDASARCRYVARYRWLSSRLALAIEDPLASCPAYGAWRQPIHAGGVTLVFPGSYLNSPSSMFGHTLLRLDPPPAEGGTVWLSQAVSFGADVRKGDNSLLYIWRGIGGGYPGRFQIEPYFTKIQHYGRMENRDLWEYPLDLDAEGIARLVDHLWEIRDTNFDYYFFDENCSYRLLELLEVARPSLQLTRDWRLSEAPVNTVRSVGDAGLAPAGGALRPSAQRELKARVTALDDDERELMLRLVDTDAALNEEVFTRLPRERQAAVLASAYATVVYRARKVQGRDPARAAHSLSLLRAINARGVSPAEAATTPAATTPAAVPAMTVPQPASPESGHRTRRLSLGGGTSATGSLDTSPRNDFGSLAFRMTYHDLLDPVRGYLPGAELEILDVELRHDARDRWQLEHLEIANVFSLSPRDPVFRDWSWRVRGGIERQPLPHLAFGRTRYLDGGGGMAWSLGSGVLLRAYAEARVEHAGAHEHEAALGAGPALGLVGQHARFNWLLDARPLHFADGFERREARAALQWQLPPDWGLRAEWRWWRAEDGGRAAEHNDAQLVLHRYF